MARCKECLHLDVCNGLYFNLDQVCIRTCRYFKEAAKYTEVAHGRWIKVADLCGIEVLKCSVCGKEHPRFPTAYCCDCGAKMDGDQS